MFCGDRMLQLLKFVSFLHMNSLQMVQGVLDRLSNIEDVASVGWIQVDQRPAKQALTALAAKWKYIYANHLERQVGNLTP